MSVVEAMYGFSGCVGLIVCSLDVFGGSKYMTK